MEPEVSYQYEVTLESFQKCIAYEISKKLIDMIGAAIGLILLSPLFLVITIMIKLDSPGPAFFSQTRYGKDGKKFKMYKFRSMEIDAEKKLQYLRSKNEMTGPIFKIKNDPRVTRVGKFIRRTSIDELPQLFNIIKGDMSIVGPRPPIDREVALYNYHQMQRLTVKPGLTCYWQTMGRSSIDFDEWVNLDIKYINERNLLIDIKLIFKTFSVLFGDENAC